MKIAIFGSGGVGGYFGGRLAAAGDDVTFIARGAHLAALQQGGLHIESPSGALHLPTVQATDDPAQVGPVDVVLFAVKLYDVDAAAATLKPMIGPNTVVITLQNGVEAVEMVAKHVGADHVAGGVAYIVVVVDQPGRLRHTVAQQLVFGERDGSRSPRLVAFEQAGVRAGFQAKASTRVESDLWIKFVRLATWSGMTTVTRSPMGVVRDNPELFTMMMAGIDETIAVGRARGIVFPPTLVDDTVGLIRNFPASSKSSMLEDLERGRRLELPWLSGAVVRLGKEAGVPTPTHQFITAVLQPFVNGTAGLTRLSSGIPAPQTNTDPPE
ncbi:MAG: 2-dehydropantoate 2-reductase [Acidobacteriota bacterium]|nr:2-dehydropantoate 2-reductase [Acidobacteriota bacterium]